MPRRIAMQILCSVVVWLASWSVHAAPPPLVLDPDASWQSTAGHVEAHFDRTERLALGDLGEGMWSPVARGHYGKPVARGVVWLRVTLSNPAKKPMQRFVAIPTSMIDSVRAIVVSGPGARHYELGEDTAIAERVVPNVHPRFPVDVPPGGSVQVVLRLVDEGTMPVPLVVGTPQGLERAENIRTLQNGLFMGMALICAGFGLLMHLRVREKIYLHLAVSSAALTAFVFTYIWGGLSPLLPLDGRTWWANRLMLVAINVAAITFGAFGATLLDFGEHLPRLKRALDLTFAVMVAMIGWTVVGSYLLAVQISVVGQGFTFVALVVGTVVLAIRRSRVARDFLVGLVVFLGAAFLMLLRAAGWLGQQLDGVMLVGFALLLLSMAAAAARRYDETVQARRRALKAQLAESERSAALSRTFEQFVPKQFLERLGHAEVTDIRLGDSVQKEMTVLFSDIRGFTTLVERMTPAENFAFVNAFLGYMEPAIHAEGGFIDKYIGDAVMALFDAPDDDGDSGASAAVAAAIHMQRALRTFNATREAEGEAPIAIGVGLHTGSLMLGTLGGQDRLNASVIGDAVNLAARIEGLTKRYGAPLLISEDTVDALGEAHGFHLRPVDRVRVKGKQQPVTVFDVIDARDDDDAARHVATLDRHVDAWQAWQEGDFQGAHDVLAALVEEGDDPTHRLWLERCAARLSGEATGPWDGVVTLDAK